MSAFSDNFDYPNGPLPAPPWDHPHGEPDPITFAKVVDGRMRGLATIDWGDAENGFIEFDFYTDLSRLSETIIGGPVILISDAPGDTLSQWHEVDVNALWAPGSSNGFYIETNIKFSPRMKNGDHIVFTVSGKTYSLTINGVAPTITSGGVFTAGGGLVTDLVGQPFTDVPIPALIPSHKGLWTQDYSQPHYGPVNVPLFNPFGSQTWYDDQGFYALEMQVNPSFGEYGWIGVDRTWGGYPITTFYQPGRYKLTYHITYTNTCPGAFITCQGNPDVLLPLSSTSTTFIGHEEIVVTALDIYYNEQVPGRSGSWELFEVWMPGAGTLNITNISVDIESDTSTVLTDDHFFRTYSPSPSSISVSAVGPTSNDPNDFQWYSLRGRWGLQGGRNYSDEFNTNGALGSPWAFPNGYTFAVSGGEAYFTGGTGSGEPIAIYESPMSTEAHAVGAKLNPTSHPGCSLIWNYLSPGNFCMWNVSTSNSAAYKFTNGTPTAFAFPSAAGYGKYAVQMSPNGHVVFWKNFDQVGTADITPHAGGLGVGFQGSSNNPNLNSIDDWGASDESSQYAICRQNYNGKRAFSGIYNYRSVQFVKATYRGPDIAAGTLPAFNVSTNPTVVQTLTASTNGGSTLTFTPTSTPVPGHTLVAIFNVSQFNGTSTITSPHGYEWQQVDEFLSSSNVNDRMFVFTRTVGDLEHSSSYTFTTSVSQQHTGVLIELTGGNYVQAKSGKKTTSGATAPNADDIIGNGAALAVWMMDGHDVSSSVSTSGWTSLARVSSPNFHQLDVAVKTPTSYGTVTGPTLSTSQTVTGSAVLMFTSMHLDDETGKAGIFAFGENTGYYYDSFGYVNSYFSNVPITSYVSFDGTSLRLHRTSGTLTYSGDPHTLTDGDVLEIDQDATSGTPIIRGKLNGNVVATAPYATPGFHYAGFYSDTTTAGFDDYLAKFPAMFFEVDNVHMEWNPAFSIQQQGPTDVVFE